MLGTWWAFAVALELDAEETLPVMLTKVGAPGLKLNVVPLQASSLPQAYVAVELALKLQSSISRGLSVAAVAEACQ